MAHKDKTRLVFNEHGKLLGATHHAGYRQVHVFDMYDENLMCFDYSERLTLLGNWLIGRMQSDDETEEALRLITKDKEARAS
jgi:hypothetical protein